MRSSSLFVPMLVYKCARAKIAFTRERNSFLARSRLSFLFIRFVVYLFRIHIYLKWMYASTKWHKRLKMETKCKNHKRRYEMHKRAYTFVRISTLNQHVAFMQICMFQFLVEAMKNVLHIFRLKLSNDWLSHLEFQRKLLPLLFWSIFTTNLTSLSLGLLFKCANDRSVRSTKYEQITWHAHSHWFRSLNLDSVGAQSSDSLFDYVFGLFRVIFISAIFPGPLAIGISNGNCNCIHHLDSFTCAHLSASVCVCVCFWKRANIFIMRWNDEPFYE